VPAIEEMKIGMKISHQLLQLVAKQIRRTAGQEAAAKTASTVSALPR
jgi:hypothetical protein